ncbi:MAG: hypothetical protein MI861_12530 [Pirellulales bacterium]|nr:hypothetical protein [Pirellulales bacterium]
MAIQNQQTRTQSNVLPQQRWADPTDDARWQLNFRPAQPWERAEALAQLFQRYPARHREVLFRWAGQVSRTKPTAFAWLYVAERGGQIRGVVWGLPSSGRLVGLWLPIIAEDEPETTRSQLVAAASGAMSQSDGLMLHANVRPGQDAERLAITANHFQYVSDIAQLVCPLADLPEFAKDDVLGFEPYSPDKAKRMKVIIRRSNEQSLDCVAIRGCRPLGDVLQGHYEREDFEPSHWRIIRHCNRDVGCLLLSRHCKRPMFDVVYLGLMPEARGYGWGGRAIRYAQRLSRAEGAAQLRLTCDVNNPPALKTYRRARFHEVDRWSFFFRPNPQPESPDSAPCSSSETGRGKTRR